VQAQPKNVDRWVEQVVLDALDEDADCTVRGDESPVPIDDERRIRLVALQHLVDGVSHGAQLGRVEVTLCEGRCVSGRQQERVAVAEWHLELLGELKHHLGARTCAAGLDEAQVARRHACLQR
jgi:hypothetical protein